MHLIIIKYSYFNYKKTWILFAKNIDIDKEIRLSTGFNERSDRILTKRPRWRAKLPWLTWFRSSNDGLPSWGAHARAHKRLRLPWFRSNTQASQLGNQQSKPTNQQTAD